MKHGIAKMKLPGDRAAKSSKPRPDFSMTKVHQERRKSVVPLLFIAAVVVTFIVIGVAVGSKKDRNDWLRQSGLPASLGRSSANRDDTGRDDKWKDLNGMSMGEWMQKNKVDSPMLKERQQRLQQHQAGRQP